MDLNFVLNDSPAASNSSSRLVDTTFNIATSTFEVRPIQHAETPAGFSHHNPSSSELPLPQLVKTYNPYQHQQSQYSTVSSRGSYSGPSLQPSTAATNPLEVPTASHKPVTAESLAYSSMNNETEEMSAGGLSFPGRHLPPLTSVHSHTSVPPASIESPLSPHSASYHYHQTGTDSGYFPSNSSHIYSYGQPQQRGQFPVFASSQQNNSHGYDTLLNFAEVAVGTATPGGRRSLEAEAAAEALAGRRGSAGSSRHSDSVVHISRAEQNKTAGSNDVHGNVASRSDKSTGHTPSHTDIDPELRPASAGSVASTGRAIDDETPTASIGNDRPLQNHRVSMITQTDGLPYNHDAPLFRPTPEASTPRQELLALPADAGTSINVDPDQLVALPSPHDFLNQSPKCSYCSICTTGSPLRKVVSHIFGRNKLSTRQIPKNVWVYYCRKHYQRSRYRNPRGFARQQVLLVKRQCERLELWGGVKDWVIKVRRREQLRMNREGDNGDDVDDDDDAGDITGGEEPEPNDGEPTSGESSRRNSDATFTRRRSSTGGNNWIMRYTGMEKTINDIYRLLERIEVEVQENGGKFPDVELLPNVDLAMAVPIRGLGSDGNEGGSSNPGDDGNREGADDDGAGHKATKRRRSDGGGGSSGGDEGSSRGAKKAKTTVAKKGSDRRGKGKAPSHAEAVPSDKVLRQSKGEAHGFQVAYQGAFSPGAPRHHEPECTEDVTVSAGTRLKRRTATPTSSTSASTRRSTPEFDLESTQSNSPANPIVDSPYLPPCRPTHILPSIGITATKEYSYGSSPPAQKPNMDFSPTVLSALTGQPLNEFTRRRPDLFVFEEIISEKPGLFDNGYSGNNSVFAKFAKQDRPECVNVAQI